MRPLIQWMAASVAGRDLRLWLTAEKENLQLRRQLLQLAEQCIKYSVTVGQLVSACREVGDSYRKEGTLVPSLLMVLMLDDTSRTSSAGSTGAPGVRPMAKLTKSGAFIDSSSRRAHTISGDSSTDSENENAE